MHCSVRHAVIPLAVGAGLVGLTGCGSSSPSAHEAGDHTKGSLINIRVGASGDNANDLPIWVAEAKGYYKREGLNVSLSVLSGETESAALASGSVQFLEDSTASFEAASAEHLPQIAVEAIGSGFPVGLVVSKRFAGAHHLTSSTPAATVAKALIGSTGGSSSAPTTGQAGLFLNEFGVKLSQVKIATLSSPAADPAALKGNEVDWFLTSEPIPLQVQAEGAGIVVGTPANVPAWTAAQTGVAEAVVTSRDYASAHPATVRKFVAATQRATKYIATHQKQVLSIDAANQPGIPRSILFKSYSISAWARSPVMSASLWRTVSATNLKIGVLKQPLALAQGVNWTNKYIQ